MPVMDRFAELRRLGGKRQACTVDSAFHTYAGLRSFRNNAKRSRSLGTARASARQIAERTGQGERTVEKNLPRLRKWGLVFIDPQPGAMTTFTFVDDPKLFGSGSERAKGMVEMENAGMVQKARSKAARDAGSRNGPPQHVADTTATRCGPPPQHVAPTPAIGCAPVAPRSTRDLEKTRAPSPDGGLVSLAQKAGKNNDHGQSFTGGKGHGSGVHRCDHLGDLKTRYMRACGDCQDRYFWRDRLFEAALRKMGLRPPAEMAVAL